MVGLASMPGSQPARWADEVLQSRAGSRVGSSCTWGAPSGSHRFVAPPGACVRTTDCARPKDLPCPAVGLTSRRRTNPSVLPARCFGRRHGPSHGPGPKRRLSREVNRGRVARHPLELTPICHSEARPRRGRGMPRWLQGRGICSRPPGGRTRQPAPRPRTPLRPTRPGFRRIPRRLVQPRRGRTSGAGLPQLPSSRPGADPSALQPAV